MHLKMIDLMSIFDIEPRDCNNWPVPNMTLREDGIWADRPSDMPEKIKHALTIEEFNALFDHPTGDYTAPVLKIPCSSEDFINFMCTQEIFDFGEFEKYKQKNNSTDNQQVMMENLKKSLRHTLTNKIKIYISNVQKDDIEDIPSMKVRQERIIISSIINLGYAPLELPINNGKRGVKYEVWKEIKSQYIGDRNGFNNRWKTMREEGKLKDS